MVCTLPDQCLLYSLVALSCIVQFFRDMTTHRHRSTHTHILAWRVQANTTQRTLYMICLSVEVHAAQSGLGQRRSQGPCSCGIREAAAWNHEDRGKVSWRFQQWSEVAELSRADFCTCRAGIASHSSIVTIRVFVLAHASHRMTFPLYRAC